MKCKYYSEKYIFFEDLSKNEKAEIKNHIKVCDKCRNYFEKNELLIKSLRLISSQNHISDELLIRYAVYLNYPNEPDYDGRRLTSDEIHDITSHIKECNNCEQKLNEFNAEFKSIESYLAESYLPDLSIGGVTMMTQLKNKISEFMRSTNEWWEGVISQSKTKYILIPVSISAILILLLLIDPFHQTIKSDLRQIAVLEHSQVSFLTRSNGVGSIRLAIFEFNEKNYLATISILEKFLLENPDNPNRAFAEYLCGMAYLFEVNKHLDKKIDDTQIQKIDRGVAHLNNAILITDRIRIKEDATWYLAKANLMKEDGVKAKFLFEQVKSFKGRRYLQAQNTLDELKKILNSTK